MSNEAGYHVRTALGWLEAGAPDGARESLGKALALVDDEETQGLCISAMRLCSSTNPRAADDVVKKIMKRMQLSPFDTGASHSEKVAALKKVNRLVELLKEQTKTANQLQAALLHNMYPADLPEVALRRFKLSNP